MALSGIVAGGTVVTCVTTSLNLLWQKPVYFGPDNSIKYGGQAVDVSGNLITSFVGTRFDDNTDPYHINPFYANIVTKLNASTGNAEWTSVTSLNGNDSTGGIVVDSSGVNIAIAGIIKNSSGYVGIGLLQLYGVNGSVLSNNFVGITGTLTGLAQDAGGEFYTAGTVPIGGSTTGEVDVIVSRWSASGTYTASLLLNPSNASVPSSVIPTSTPGLLCVGGLTRPYQSANNYIFQSKFSLNDSALGYQTYYNGP